MAGLLVACFSVAVSRAAVYYVSPSGQDTNSGTSPAAAWQTISRANAQNLSAGDQMLFQGGSTFQGTIFIGYPEGGTAANPIMISSYGTGRATINGGTTNGFYAYDCAGIIVSNLNFVGSGRTTNQNSGIEFFNDGGGLAPVLDFLRVNAVDVSGFGFAGVIVGAWGPNAYRDVRLTDADSHDNGISGIETSAEYSNLITNLYVGYCRAWNNPGITDMPDNGGIVLRGVNNALVERCVVWTNGWFGDATAGIWTYDSTNVTVQFCESHHNRTTSTGGGNGFDLDAGVTGSVLQYNYSHDNDGAGYGVFAGASPYSNNVVRYNISQNDGRTNSFAGIQLWNNNSGIRNVDIYNNTIFVSPAGSGTPRAVYFQSAVPNVHLRNNLFVTTGGARLVEGPSGQSGVLFQGNNYWSSGGTFVIKWGGSTYSSLDSWRTASGLERIGTTNVGFSVDPQLANPGGGGTLGDADLLDTLTAYQLQPYSPLREAGLNLTSLFGLNPGPIDFYGDTVPNGLAPDVGAFDGPLVASLTASAIEAGYFNATYIRSSPTRTDLVYTVETSTDFTNWCGTCAIPVLTNNLGNGTEAVKVRETTLATDAATKFFRLDVTRAR